MRQLLVTILGAAALYGQPAANLPFGGLTADSASSKPAVTCKDLRSLTSLDLSVIGATVIERRPARPSTAASA
ncbi:MAG: hypothetical protein ABI806_21050 [Candidatus Solibacter sp.]